MRRTRTRLIGRLSLIYGLALVKMIIEILGVWKAVELIVEACK